jgi:adenylate cyclase
VEPGVFDPDRFRDEPSMTARQVAERAGVDLETAKRTWRALGFPDADDDEVAFDERDLDSLRSLSALVSFGFPIEDLITMARTYGQAMSRIADAETRLFHERFLKADEPADEATLDAIVPRLLDLVGVTIENIHRRHLSSALRQLTQAHPENSGSLLAVGFADLVDFSTISGDLPGGELSSLVGHFEELAIEVCTGTGVRLVKTIGDAVMFVSADAEAALSAAMEIVTTAASDSVLPPARAGLDMGDALPLGGDYFGRPVNVAARITAYALPSTVVVSKDLLEHVGREMDVSRIGRRKLKGVGEILLFKVKGKRESD